jgi:hypothetical protein
MACWQIKPVSATHRKASDARSANKPLFRWASQRGCPVVRIYGNGWSVAVAYNAEKEHSRLARRRPCSRLRNVAEKLFAGRVLRAFFVGVLAAMKELDIVAKDDQLKTIGHLHTFTRH